MSIRTGATTRAAALAGVALCGLSTLAVARIPEQSAPPTLFAPGSISVADESSSAPSFFPGDHRVVFERGSGDKRHLYFAEKTGSGWSTPVVAPFSRETRDFEPAVSTDGTYIVFVSSRPLPGSSSPLDGHWNGKDHPGSGGNLWATHTSTESRWSAPQRIGDTVNSSNSVFEPALASDGTLYFMRPDPATDKFHIYSARRSRDGYGTAERFPYDGMDPAVAPDQSYIVFSKVVDTPARLQVFISLRSHGAWTTPLRLPEAVNGLSSNQDNHLSADQQTLYFTHDDRIWNVPFQPILRWAHAQAAPP